MIILFGSGLLERKKQTPFTSLSVQQGIVSNACARFLLNHIDRKGTLSHTQFKHPITSSSCLNNFPLLILSLSPSLCLSPSHIHTRIHRYTHRYTHICIHRCTDTHTRVLLIALSRHVYACSSYHHSPGNVIPLRTN